MSVKPLIFACFVRKRNAPALLNVSENKRNCGKGSTKPTEDLQNDPLINSTMKCRQRKTVGAELKRRQLFKKGKKPNKFTYPRKW